MRFKRKLGVLILSIGGLVVVASDLAYAIVGMPATPMSYAGVARRTVRRSYYY